MAYLTINEAVKKFGKSESTFRRLIRDVRKSQEEAKRRLIRPSEDEIKQHRQDGTNYSYTIDEELIVSEVMGEQQVAAPDDGAQRQSSAEFSPDFVERLEQRHQAEIQRLEKRLGEERKEKLELLKLAQEDKTLFANAASSLARLVSSPQILQLLENARQDEPHETASVDPPKNASREQESPKHATHTSDNKPPPAANNDSPLHKKKSFWRRLRPSFKRKDDEGSK